MGDLIAKCAMLDCIQSGSAPANYNYPELSNQLLMGLFQKASPGQDDFGTPLYYSLPTDTVYSTTFALTGGQGCVHCGVEQTVVFHAPNQAQASGGTEHELAIWDQSTGWVLALYMGGGGTYNTPTLPAPTGGCGTSLTNPCVFATYEYSAAVNLYTGQDYNYGGPGAPGYASNGFGPFAATLREAELMNGINHAGMVTLECVSATTPFVFPANTNPRICGTGGSNPSNTQRASSGTLLFCDYTPAQIASFGLPVWQTRLLTQFCVYGDYVSESGGYGITLVGDENIESSQAWSYYYAGTFPCTYSATGGPCYNNPFWPWLTAQKGLHGDANLTEQCATNDGTSRGTSPLSAYKCQGGFLANIPRTIGPEGSDAEGNSCTVSPGCYPSGHVHVADVCVAEGYAGVSGGCF